MWIWQKVQCRFPGYGKGLQGCCAQDSVTYERGRSQNKLRASSHKSRLCYCLRLCEGEAKTVQLEARPTMVCLGPSTYIKVLYQPVNYIYMPTVIGYPQNRYRMGRLIKHFGRRGNHFSTIHALVPSVYMHSCCFFFALENVNWNVVNSVGYRRYKI